MATARTATLREYLTVWLPRVRARTRPRTAYLYDWLIARHLGGFHDRKLRDLSRLDVHDLVTRMQTEGLAPATIKQTLTLLAMILRDAVDDELLVRNVAHGFSRKIKLRPVRPPTIYDAGQLALFMQTAERTYPDLAPLFSLCSGAGLRIGEARGIRGDDLDFQTQTVRVCRSIRDSSRVGPTKTGIARIVDLPASTLRLCEPFRRRVGWCFPGRDRGTVLSYTTIRVAMRAICAEARIPPGSPHAFRHAFASIAIAEGEPIEVVRRALGHLNIQTTMRYCTHLPIPRSKRLDAM